VDQPSTVVKSDIIEIKLYIAYIVSNNISNAGCKWLSKANSKKLNYIALSKNIIS